MSVIKKLSVIMSQWNYFNNLFIIEANLGSSKSLGTINLSEEVTMLNLRTYSRVVSAWIKSEKSNGGFWDGVGGGWEIGWDKISFFIASNKL